MSDVLRIIDANANRAREALRVMEEAARFVLDDAALSEACKTVRHELAEACATIDGLIFHRDTPGDVGTNITTDNERTRESINEVVIAAGKRLGEAMRVLEEYGKTLTAGSAGPTFGPTIEALRYRGYDIEQRLITAMGSRRASQWRCCVLISEALCRGGDWRGVVEGAIEGGADCIQLREKQLEGGELLARARQLVSMCRPRGVSVIVNDRPDVAILSGADGVHVGQGDLSVREVRKLVGTRLIVGVSTSELEQAKRAKADGADYCGVGPMFVTTTKDKPTIAGPRYLKRYVAWGGLPHLAIGGIDAGNVVQLIAVGMRAVAVSSAVCAAKDPCVAVSELVDVMTMTLADVRGAGESKSV